jgi:hypothetical protein
VKSITSLNRRAGPPDGHDVANRAAGNAAALSAGTSLQQRREHPRVAVAGKVRLVADTSGGLVTLSGQVTDLSLGGCAIHVHTCLEPSHEARLELTLDGEQVWVPGHIMWTRVSAQGWLVGIKFDKLVPQKQALIMRLVAERRRYAI